MGNDDKVLSQAEIDALLGNSAPPATPKAAVPPPKAAPPPVKTAVAPPPIAVKPAAPPPTPPPPAAKPAVPPPVAVKPEVITPTPAPAPQPALQVIHQGPTPEEVTRLCKQVVSAEARDLTKQIVELTIKVNKLDVLKQRMDSIEGKIDEIAGMVQSSPSATDALTGRMDELYDLLQNMRHQTTDEERIHDQFHCVKCHSEKMVAIHVKCTECGMENWMGWFPEGQRNNIQEHY